MVEGYDVLSADKEMEEQSGERENEKGAGLDDEKQEENEFGGEFNNAIELSLCFKNGYSAYGVVFLGNDKGARSDFAVVYNMKNGASWAPKS